jgi:hypothetical protein
MDGAIQNRAFMPSDEEFDRLISYVVSIILIGYTYSKSKNVA